MPYLWAEIEVHLGVHLKPHDILTVKNTLVIPMYYVTLYTTRKKKKKGKAIPLQALTDP